MKTDQGCELLDSCLGELLRQVMCVRRSLATVDTAPASGAEHARVNQALGELAAVVARTLRDVGARLELLDEVLKRMHQRSLDRPALTPSRSKGRRREHAELAVPAV